jgi:hypothetical protein
VSAALGIAAASIVALSIVQLVSRQQRARHEHTIIRLLAESEKKEKAGELGSALLDLDTAITLEAESTSPDGDRLEQLREKRGELARRDVREISGRLQRAGGDEFPIKEWLNLRGRTGADPDLAPVRESVAQAFEKELEGHLASRIEKSGALLHSGRATSALEQLRAGASLLKHVPDGDHDRLQGQLREQAEIIARTHGIRVDPPRGQFLGGSEARYMANLVPTLRQAAILKGYVPEPEASPWSDLWNQAPYRLSLQVRERYEGTYLGSENRLVRIETHLELFNGSRGVWQTAPSARTTVPLPRLPAYLSARLALGPKRIDEFERMLYDNAREQIDARLAFALAHLPGWGFGAP